MIQEDPEILFSYNLIAYLENYEKFTKDYLLIISPLHNSAFMTNNTFSHLFELPMTNKQTKTKI